MAEWEREYKNGEVKHKLFENARNFDADIIVARFIENCPGQDFDCKIFKNQLNSLLIYLNKSQKAQKIFQGNFEYIKNNQPKTLE